MAASDEWPRGGRISSAPIAGTAAQAVLVGAPGITHIIDSLYATLDNPTAAFVVGAIRITSPSIGTFIVGYLPTAAGSGNSADVEVNLPALISEGVTVQTDPVAGCAVSIVARFHDV